MKKADVGQMPVTDTELDEALAQMAEEVPPMPADFLARWMNAVRAEAGSTAPAGESVPKQPLSIVRWTRILSVAAVFVFLIGGTLLYRNSKKSLTSSVPVAMEKREYAEEAAAEEQLMMESYMQAAAVDEAAGAPANAEAEDREALKAAGAVQNANVFAAAPKAKPAKAAEAEAEEADYAMDAAEYEEEPVMGAASYEAAEEAPTPEPTAVPTVEPEPEQTGFLPAAGAFFTDMGDFLLAALPYLAVLAVPAVAALLLGRRKKQKQ